MNNKRNHDDNDEANDADVKRSKNNINNGDDVGNINDDENESDDFGIEDEENFDSNDDDEEFSDEEISVEFTAHDPVDDDFHGIRCLLQQLWLKENLDISELTELLIKDTITTVLKQSFDHEDGNDGDDKQKSNKKQPKDEDDEEKDEDDDNVFGVISIIPFNDHFNEKNCVRQIKQILLSYLPKNNEIHRKLLDKKSKCALIINERFVNLPPKISIPCYKQLLTEIQQQQQQQQSSSKYEFDHIIMISKLSKFNNEIIYTNAEDEIFEQNSDHHYEYSVQKQSDTHSIDWNDDDKTFEPFRRLFLINRQKWIETVNNLESSI